MAPAPFYDALVRIATQLSYEASRSERDGDRQQGARLRRLGDQVDAIASELHSGTTAAAADGAAAAGGTATPR